MNPKKVLIVDDNAVVVAGLSNVLSQAGYQVLSAEDGAGAVSTVRRESPDLVLLDINYPPDVAHGGGVAWDGFLIMTWLGRMEEAKNTAIAIITGADPAQFKARALKAGAVAYFQKPLDPNELLAAVREIIGDPPDAPETLADEAGSAVETSQ